MKGIPSTDDLFHAQKQNGKSATSGKLPNCCGEYHILSLETLQIACTYGEFLGRGALRR